MLKKILLLFVFFTSVLEASKDYYVLENAYKFSISGGVGVNYLSKIKTPLPTLALNSEFIILDSFGLTFNDYMFANNTKDFFMGNNMGLSITIRPMLAIRFVKDKLSMNYRIDYFYNSMAFNFGGIIQYTKFSRGEVFKNINAVGTKIGVSFAFLLYYDKKADYYLKTSIDYNFLQDMLFYENYYDMNGLYVQIVFGVSFRFGKDISWLIGKNENDDDIVIKEK